MRNIELRMKAEGFPTIVKYLDPDRIEIQVARQEPLRLEVLDFLDRIEREERVDVQYAIDALALASGV
jgi:hypothetical protein